MDEVQEEAVAVIDETLRLLEHHGWCQGTAQDADGKMCLGYAQTTAARVLGVIGCTDEGHRTEMGIALHQAFIAIHPNTLGILAFNDHEDTTYQDVVNTLKLMREEILNPQDEVLL